MSYCYATGDATGDHKVGGLVGYNNRGEVSDSYATGDVTGGGLVGHDYKGDVSDSFWDVETSGQDGSDGGTGKTTENVKNVRTFTDVGWSDGLDNAWDFVGDPYDDESDNDVWNIDENGEINNGYPYLTGLEPEPKVKPVQYFNLTSHDPIHIEGNSDFSDNDADGVINPDAAGTENDPYIIENWMIDASENHGVWIENTTDHFVIRNCIVENGEYDFDGVYLENTKNGRIENTKAENNYSGFYLSNSSNNVLVNNLARNNDSGFDLTSSSNNVLENNLAQHDEFGSWAGFYLSNSSENNVLRNNLAGKSYCGFSLDYTNNVNNVLENNLAQNNDHGFRLEGHSENNLLRNNLAENNGDGFWVPSSNNVENNLARNNDLSGFNIGSSNNVENNLAENNGDGFSVSYSNNVFVNNLARNNDTGFGLTSSSNNVLENNLAENNNSEGFHLSYSSENNVFVNNLARNNDTGFYFSYSSNIRISECFIENNENGVRILGSFDNIEISYNNIVNNNLYGIINENTNTTVNAENNWWGDNSGPSGAGPGTGDKVSENVDYEPWLESPYREKKVTPVEYYRSLEPSGEISKQNVVQAIQDCFKEKKIPEIGRRLKKRDVVKLIKAYFDRVLP